MPERGPWFAIPSVEDGEYYSIKDAVGSDILFVTVNEGVCVTDARMSLMLTAPDMAEALRELVADWQAGRDLGKAVRVCRTVLAKVDSPPALFRDE